MTKVQGKSRMMDKLEVHIYEKDRDGKRFELAAVTGWTYGIIRACIGWNMFSMGDNWINGAPQINSSQAGFTRPGKQQDDFTELSSTLKSSYGHELMPLAAGNKNWETVLGADAYEQMVFDLTGTKVKLDWLKRMTGDQRTEEEYATAADSDSDERVIEPPNPKGKRKRDEFLPEKEEKKEQKMVVWLAALGAAAAAMFYF